MLVTFTPRSIMATKFLSLSNLQTVGGTEVALTPAEVTFLITLNPAS
jgi:hypothetical protein